ncbi:hypothetical protein AZE42_09121 [Rhizopogon vesiculosus]|uniref:Ketoreductase (KR) domain-containing protein n=1 Tax=Rhizopogon vesiculosus TaxID=180088 RepID=A0A1J8QUG5_9AGAM|nr:hypothetical protein AZE42_09121 [Rhizopogon vesiculosus]
MGKFNFFEFIREQWTELPVPTANVSGKSLVVVGANVGLGNEAAVHLAQLKPKSLLITTRDEVKLQVNYLSTALLSILMLPHLVKSGTPESASRLVIVSSNVHYIAHTLNGADKWDNIIEKLNDQAYCTSSSVMGDRYPLSKLLEVLFVRELSSRLPTPTMVAVSAVNPDKWDNIIEKLNDQAYCTSSSVMEDRYNLSKLLEVLFVRELFSRLPTPTMVAVSTANPGLCQSSLTRSASPLLKLRFTIQKYLLARPTEMGSRTLVHPAIEPGERERHGHYLSGCKVAEECDYALSAEGKEVSKRMWNETIKILADIDPRVNAIVSEHLVQDVA